MSITISELSFTYPDGRCGLKDINLHIKKGRKTAVLGINGSGKSTLLYHLNGTFMPQKGTVQILGMELEKKNLMEIRKKVGFLFDYPDNQLFATTVGRDVSFGPMNYGWGQERIEPAVDYALSQVGMLELKEYPPYQLSLGQKKRVAIAGVFIMEPDIILCDEPFSGLDPLAEEQFKSVLDQWISLGKTIVFSTHNVDLAYEWADDAVVMHNGTLLASGKCRQVLGDKEVMNRASLKAPLIARLFEGFENKPESISEAVNMLKKYRR
jgi:cobalt/nickel transport system ATP-binding protein